MVLMAKVQTAAYLVPYVGFITNNQLIIPVWLEINVFLLRMPEESEQCESLIPMHSVSQDGDGCCS